MTKPLKNNLFGLSGSVKDQLAQKMLEKRLKKVTEAQMSNNTAGSDVKRSRKSLLANSKIPDEFCRFDQFPGYQQIRILETGGKQMGVSSPFFKVHEGVARNTTHIAGQEYINFASYNYLDLCGHPAVSQAAKDAIDKYGTSASASRPVAGERPIQRELEQQLAKLYDVDDAIVFVSGHATNVTTIGYLFGPKDLILHDSLIHNSIVQGGQLSGATRLPFPHNDWQALDEILFQQRKKYERVLIVIEGIYSMDGDYPDLKRFIEIKQRHKAFLMVDEAHSLGVLGERGHGLKEQSGVDGHEVDLWMGTLSKTLASCGGYIAGENALIEHLKFSAPGFLYSVGIAPPVAASALAAIKLLDKEPERVHTLNKRGKQFLKLARKHGLNVGSSAGLSVIPVITGSSATAGRLANALFERGINVQPIFYPAVQEGMARLRFFICSSHTEEQIEQTIAILVEEMARLS